MDIDNPRKFLKRKVKRPGSSGSSKTLEIDIDRLISIKLANNPNKGLIAHNPPPPKTVVDLQDLALSLERPQTARLAGPHGYRQPRQSSAEPRISSLHQTTKVIGQPQQPYSLVKRGAAANSIVVGNLMAPVGAAQPVGKLIPYRLVRLSDGEPGKNPTPTLGLTAQQLRQIKVSIYTWFKIRNIQQ